MHTAHALNLYDSLHTMLDMESSKKGPDVSSANLPASRAARQTSAINRLQICCCQQQQFQQQ